MIEVVSLESLGDITWPPPLDSVGEKVPSLLSLSNVPPPLATETHIFPTTRLCVKVQVNLGLKN